MSLAPVACAKPEEANLVVVFSGSPVKAECFDRDFLIEEIEREGKCDYSSAVLIKKFRNFTLFQKYTIGRTCHYRPLVGSVQSYIDGLISKDLIKTDGKEVSENTLGEGTFGRVVRYGDSSIAVKVSKNPFDSDIQILNEFNIMKMLMDASPCCIAGAFDIRIDRTVSLYMKRMKGDLYTFLQEGQTRGREKKIMYDLCKGIYYAHSRGILHRDLKSENILIDADWSANIADWGLSTYKPLIERDNYSVQTATYRAPEVWLPNLFVNKYRDPNDRYSFPIDIFSLGVIGMELYTRMPHSTGVPVDSQIYPGDMRRYGVTGEFDWLSKLLANLYGIKTEKDLVTIPNKNFPVNYMRDSVPDKQGYSLFARMMSNRPSDRPTIAEVLRDPYFDEVRDGEFPQITYASILSKTPVFTETLSTVPLNEKIEAFTLMSEQHEVKVFFAAIDIYNRYTAIKPPSRKKGLTASACLNIASCLCDDKYLSYDRRAFVRDEIIEEISTIAKTLKYQLISCNPSMYFKPMPERVARMLCVFELSQHSDIHPYSVAKCVGSSIGALHIQQGLDLPDKTAEILEGIVSVCEDKTTEVKIATIVRNLNIR